MEEAVRLYIHTGTEYHCMEFTNKAQILTREATLVLASKIHETGKAYLISQTRDALLRVILGLQLLLRTGFRRALTKFWF
jgi:hypothetical protein